MAISHFLEAFRHAEHILYGHGNKIIPPNIIIDRSITLLVNCVKDFLLILYEAITIAASEL